MILNYIDKDIDDDTQSRVSELFIDLVDIFNLMKFDCKMYLSP